jgi:NADPH2:quinone reductase
MRAVRIHEHGDESVLRTEEIDRPTPASNGVVLAVHAAAVNPFDTYVREGIVPPEDGGLPHIIGGDAAGEIAAVGDDVVAFEPGDRAFVTGLGLDGPGTYAEYVAVPEHRVAHLPAAIPFGTGAAAAETVTTSRMALDRGGVDAGDVVLVQGAAGGVGHAAVQVAAHEGAFVVGTCRPGSMDAVRDLGADAVIDYATEDLAAAVLDATGGRPVDAVIETHAAANVAADVEALATDGTIVILGEDDDITVGGPTAGTAKGKQATLAFVSHMRSTEHHGEALAAAARLLRRNAVAVTVDATFPLEEAGAAQRHCLSSGGFGKTLLDVAGEEST